MSQLRLRSVNPAVAERYKIIRKLINEIKPAKKIFAEMISGAVKILKGG